jgi:hypothetical protein
MAITVPIGFLAIMKAEKVISRSDWPEAVCFCAVRWVTLRREESERISYPQAKTRPLQLHKYKFAIKAV